MDIKLVKTLNEIKDEELLFEIKTPNCKKKNNLRNLYNN